MQSPTPPPMLDRETEGRIRTAAWHARQKRLARPRIERPTTPRDPLRFTINATCAEV